MSRFVVAGARLELASSGNEPDKVPLLYPASISYLYITQVATLK